MSEGSCSVLKIIQSELLFQKQKLQLMSTVVTALRVTARIQIGVSIIWPDSSSDSQSMSSRVP